MDAPAPPRKHFQPFVATSPAEESNDDEVKTSLRYYFLQMQTYL